MFAGIKIVVSFISGIVLGTLARDFRSACP